MTRSDEAANSKNEDLVAHPSTKPPTANPFAQSANITVSVPESVEIKLVDASALGDYEVWVLLTSVLASAVTGFLVAVVQASAAERSRFVAITIVFAVLGAICATMAIVKRRRLSRRTRKVKFRVGEPVQDDTAG